MPEDKCWKCQGEGVVWRASITGFDTCGVCGGDGGPVDDSLMSQREWLGYGRYDTYVEGEPG